MDKAKHRVSLLDLFFTIKTVSLSITAKMIGFQKSVAISKDIRIFLLIAEQKKFKPLIIQHEAGVCAKAYVRIMVEKSARHRSTP